MSGVELPKGTRLRVEILDLRQRIERASASVYDAAWLPSQLGTQNRTEKRLAHLWTLKGGSTVRQVSAAIRMSGHVYRKTSDVLHGRHGIVNVPDAVLNEWKAIVNNLEQIVSAGSAATTTNGSQ